MTGSPPGPVVLGTAAFAVPILESLAGSRHRPSLVVTRVDSKAGRGLRESVTPVAEAACTLGLPVVKTSHPSSVAGIPEGCRFAVSAAFGLWLPAKFIALFPQGVLNVHPSLLPKYPGLDTHARAMAAGDAEHGASVHVVTPELDGGPVLAQVRMPLLAGDTAESVARRLLAREHPLLVQSVRAISEGRAQLGAQRIQYDGRWLERPLQLDERDELRLV